MNGGEQERDSLVYLIPNGFLHLPLVYLLFKKFTVKSCLFKNYFFSFSSSILACAFIIGQGHAIIYYIFKKREIEKKEGDKESQIAGLPDCLKGHAQVAFIHFFLISFCGRWLLLINK